MAKTKNDYALELYDFIYSYYNETSDEFDKKYHKYDIWRSNNKGANYAILKVIIKCFK